MSKPALETIEYGGWPNCLRLTDGRVELVVTTDVGPRIIRFGKPNGPNVFGEFADQLGLRGGTKWRIYGGHRLWIAPEIKPITYAPDNRPVKWEWDGKQLALEQEPDQPSQLQKRIRIRFERGGVRLEHELVNKSRKTFEIAPWAMSVMAKAGTAVMPQEPYGSHEKNLLPCRPLVLWKYTKMNDPRWRWGEKVMMLRQDPSATSPQKIGFRSSPAWLAYLLPHGTFIKRHPFDPNAVYPDMGCNAEVFTNADILELETLGPLQTLKPGKSLRHMETWRLFDEVLESTDEETLLKGLEPLIAATPRPA